MSEKTSKDMQKYFQAPSLKDAKVRRHSEVQVLKDEFTIPEEMLEAGINKKFYIRTYGCQMNEHDEEVMAGILESMGYSRTDDTNDADVILLNTCAVRENAEDKVFGKLGELKHLKLNNPEVILGVCGCMSQEEAVVNRILTKHQHVDIIFGTHNIHRLPQILHNAYMSKEMVVEVWSKEGDIIENLPKTRNDNIRGWINITYGCDKFCTYCIIPYTRGKERSRLPEDVLAEVQELADKGYQEITLLGQNVNSYGSDLGDGSYTFASLLADVQKINIPRVRFSTSHPWQFTDEMIEVLSNGGNLMPHVHLPVQAGSDHVLKLMRRQYSGESYRELYNKLRSQIPNVSITTDIIVGFPTETDEQFQETMALVNDCQFDGAFTFIYSPREGTPAARMSDNIPTEVKKARLQELNKKVNADSLQHNQGYIGQELDVLVVGRSQKGENTYAGYTPQSKAINFIADDSYIGKIVKVRVTEARTWSMQGELIEA